jgi:hypothetical protein
MVSKYPQLDILDIVDQFLRYILEFIVIILDIIIICPAARL